MLENLENDFEDLPYKEIFLYWGGRYQKDIYWDPCFKKLPLKYRPVLSRDRKWNGRVGYVQDQVLADELDLKSSVVYACGSEKMIASSFLTFSNAGLPVNSFYSDAFVTTS